MVKKSKVVYFVVSVVLCMLSSCFITGCATTGLQRKDTELIATNSRNIGRVESTAENLGELVGRSQERLEIVRRASERIGETTERLDYLFTEYEREVERILDELYTLKEQQEQMERNSNNTNNSNSIIYSVSDNKAQMEGAVNGKVTNSLFNGAEFNKGSEPAEQVQKPP